MMRTNCVLCEAAGTLTNIHILKNYPITPSSTNQTTLLFLSLLSQPHPKTFLRSEETPVPSINFFLTESPTILS